MAEGARGRRWRAVGIVDGRVSDVLLLEATPGGRPTRLELTTGSGLLTLHPAPDERAAHGNVVHVGGVRPLELPWGPDHAFEVADRPIAMAIALGRLARLVAVGEGETVEVLAVDRALVVRPGTRLVRRIGERRWEVADLGSQRATEIELDADGAPHFAGSDSWPLEP
jgi:hypothetical protein